MTPTFLAKLGTLPECRHRDKTVGGCFPAVVGERNEEAIRVRAGSPPPGMGSADGWQAQEQRCERVILVETRLARQVQCGGGLPPTPPCPPAPPVVDQTWEATSTLSAVDPPP